jgi:hypothetical protein
MREVYESSRDTTKQKTASARDHVADRFTWAQVAQRHTEACARALESKRGSSISVRSASPRHIGFITTWNARCGIAEYTRFLSSGISSERRFSVFGNHISDAVREDEPNVARCWTTSSSDLPADEIDELVERICAAGCEVVSIQYNFGLLSPGSVDRIIRRLRPRGISVAVTLHATANEKYTRLVAILKDAGAVIVHRTEERDRLVASRLANIHLQRQGIYVPKNLQRVTPAGSDKNLFTVACFGFFLPPKGIYELLQAF